LYEDGGGFLTADGTMTLAFGRAYGGSTVVYTGTSLIAPSRVIRRWSVPGLEYGDVERRAQKYMAENSVHFLPRVLINENNKLFAEGCARAGYHAEQFPLNLKGCKGSSLCNLGCPNAAKMGTNRVQLPNAEAQGVEVVTRAEVLRLEDHAAIVRVSEKLPGRKGLPSTWAPGEYRVKAQMIVLCGGAIGTPALLLRSSVTAGIKGVGRRFTCHPAHILVAEHDRPITNDVGHPKSYYLDRAADEGYVLETCMYFPFVTAKNLTGFGDEHAAFMRRFPRLQMILVLACDGAVPENRITVDNSGKPVVHYRFTPPVVKSFVAATRVAARIFFAAGALRVHAPEAEPPAIDRRDAYRVDDLITANNFIPGRTSVSAAHLMGGCAMGRGGDSVTDSRGRLAGFPWLRVADASLFPDALEINPYLTIMALADRVAEGVRNEIGALSEVNVA
ncbi:MAG: GMC family oxidoreductase N-terminal domain-containing protein, partial [Gemmatimonadaceae bacterium]